MIQELDQHQLGIRHRIDPQFDPLTHLAEFDQSEPLPTEYAATTPVEKMQPIRDRRILFRRTRREQPRKLRIRRQRPPDKAKAKGNDEVGETRPHESPGSGVLRCQDKARHVRLRTADGQAAFQDITASNAGAKTLKNGRPRQRRALKTSATQCPQRPRAALERSPLEFQMSISN
ncbi:MAG: hypothetical protein JO052_12870 [Bradyrhizobium sp.]|nr:hypothetical protein [Bradyrhizobium sp.]